ncbi:MAG TPA: DNA methyltransferase, partial [Cytophagales bacterium]
MARKLPIKSSPLLRLNTICPYYTMFPIDFPFKKLIRAKKGEWVLDPFCGRGTTNYAARLSGLNSFGVDSNPVAVAIATSKLVNVNAFNITALAQNIISNSPEVNIPEGEFWHLCYHENTLRKICKIRQYLLKNCATEEEFALRGVMLGILHGPINKNTTSYLSNQMPRTFASKPTYSVKYW